MLTTLARRLQILGYPEAKIEIPSDLINGDLTTNVALQYAKQSGKNPLDLAGDIVNKLGNVEGLERVTVAGPGFINFWLSDKSLVEAITDVINNPTDYVANDLYKGQRVMLEYTTQNVLKEFHVGHLMSNIIGSSIANLYANAGAIVKRESYQGDVGMHIAKAVWGIKNLILQNSIDDLEAAVPLNSRSQFLGQSYAVGDKAFNDDQVAKSEIEQINKDIYSKVDNDNYRLYVLARKWSIESYQETYNRLGIELDYSFFESETAEIGVAETNKALEKGILQKSDGAIVYLPKDGEKLIPVVFINSAGLPTYAAKDLGLIALKKQTWPEMDQTVVFTAAEQNGHFKVVKKVVAQLYPELDKDFLTHVGHGYLSLTTGKMSSRTGEVLEVNYAIDQVKSAVLEKMADRDIVQIQKDLLAEQIAQAALRFTILRGDIHRDVVFDFDQALSFEGDSGPYLQYSVVRLRSVVTRANLKGITPSLEAINSEDFELVRLIYQIPSVITKATNTMAPQGIVVSLLQLAQAANSYYATNKIIDESDILTSSHRLAIVTAVANILESSLSLLGITVPTEM